MIVGVLFVPIRSTRRSKNHLVDRASSRCSRDSYFQEVFEIFIQNPDQIIKSERDNLWNSLSLWRCSRGRCLRGVPGLSFNSKTKFVSEKSVVTRRGVLARAPSVSVTRLRLGGALGPAVSRVETELARLEE